MKKKKPSRSGRWEQKSKQPEEGTLFIAGENGVSECLKSPSIRILNLWAEPRRLSPKLTDLIKPKGGLVRPLVNGETPYGPASQGVAALIKKPQATPFADGIAQIKARKSNPLLLLLDQVEDPMNLGQILRTCEGAGVDALVLPQHRSVSLNQTVAQISQGAFVWVPMLEIVNLRQALEHLKSEGFWIVGCDGGEGARLWHQWDFKGPTAVVLGAEGRGMRALTKKTCDQLIKLPMMGEIESLNVGAAAAAILYEVVRQRLSNG